jgi:spore germination protein YaaH
MLLPTLSLLYPGEYFLMKKEVSGRKKGFLFLIPFIIVLLILLVSHIVSTGNVLIISQLTSNSAYQPNVVAQNNQTTVNMNLFNGHTPSLSWIVGRDCQRGVQAYLQNARTNPDAALVGTGWLDPTTGKLINGQSNNCVAGSLSMDSVVQLIHQYGGKAYLTITMETDGAATSWTTAQQTAYEVKATQTPGYIDPIINEVVRVGYDGVIMDLEGTDNFYPDIQQIFATYNQQVWHALQPLHKLYGIALLHKLSAHDEYYSLNGFENWHLLGQSADFLVIMAVDQSYFTPGPCVSVSWLKQLLDYTMQTMPQMLPHIVWELPLYGDSWYQSGGQWVFDGTIIYQDAMNIVDQVSRAQIDQANSNLQDPYQPHLVYTDVSGVTHSLWFMNAQSLRNIMHDFQQLLRQEPQFAHGTLQFAVWWLTTSEPPDFWTKVDTLY